MAELDVNIRPNFTTDDDGKRRLSITKTYTANDVTEETDAEGNKLPVYHTVDVTKVVASDYDDYNTMTSEDFITFGDVDINKAEVTFADKDRKAALLEGLHDAKNEGELAVAMQAITDSYNSTTNNIGQKGYEEALRVAAAKKNSFEAGATDEVQAGNATNVEGNAYDVRDADSRGDNRTVDIVDGNSNADVDTGSIRDDTATLTTQFGNGGTAEEGDGEGVAGTGTGNGVGDGTDTGVKDDFDAQKAANKSFVDDVTPSTAAATMSTGNVADDAASYAAAISDEPQINHIFHNNFYDIPAVPQWAFSVDFIPCGKSENIYNTLVNLEALKTLTRAVISLTANEKSVAIGKLNYLGMQHPFFTKIEKTNGDLNIKFAENEEYEVTKLLMKLFKFGSFVPSFPTYEIPIVQNSREDTMKYAVLNDKEWHVTKAPDDITSPAYKLNAPTLSVDDNYEVYDAEYTKLAHANKFLVDIVVKLYKAANTHAFNDDDNEPQYVYHYHRCWLKNIEGINLDYNDDTPIDRDVTFAYQYLTTCSYSEYLAKYTVNPPEATQDEMIDYADKINDLNELEDLDVDDTPTGNRSPANMSPEAAKEFRDTYAPTTPANNMNGYSEYMNNKSSYRGANY